MTKPDDPKPGQTESPFETGRVPLRVPRDLWQVPVLLLGLALAVAGVAVWIRGAPGPDFRAALNDANTLIERQEYTRALEILNGPVRNEIGGTDAAPEIRAEFHALRADALYLAQKESPPATPQAARTNNTTILAEYEEAGHADEHLITPRRRAFIAETLLDLGRRDEALHELESIPAAESERRHRLLKRVIDDLLASSDRADTRRAENLIEDLRKDRALPEGDRLWITGRHAGIRLSRGDAEAVINELLPEIQRLESRDGPEAGELFLLLGRAYLEEGQPERAREQLALAERVLPPGNERRGLADVLLARIAQNAGEAEEARDRFASVAERFPDTPTQLVALLGLAETEADLGRFDESLDAYRRLNEQLPKHAGIDSVTPQVAEASAAQRLRARLSAEDLARAVDFAEVALQAHPERAAPPEALARLADAHAAFARSLVGAHDEETAPIPTAGAEDLETARRHFERAREFYERHAREAMVEDPDGALRSLWNAADSADHAGDLDGAVRLFTQYAQSRRGDPARLQAQFRLARAFQAKGEFETAINLFEEIIRTNPGSDEAYRAYVPLAQSHILAGHEGGEAKAEERLLQVVSGRLFQPTSPQFRDGLIELGRLYLSTGRYADAIERLDEALRRYPEDANGPRLRFDLADANRLSAALLEKRLGEAMPLTERAEVERIRLERLHNALALYAQVRADLESVPPERLSPLERVTLRNTIFYRADCAYDLGQFDDAIKFYDAAAQRYASDPASLVAMVQIVNCYASLGKWREARTAHERARARLKELPEGSWQAAAVPMDRRHWERWLEASMRLDQADARADAEPE